MSTNFAKTVIADSGDEDEVTEFRNNLPAFRGINSVVEINNDENTKDVKSNDKIQESDVKRQNALAEKWKTLQKQKFTITSALQGELLNKKIKFDENGSQQEHKNKHSQSTTKKITLFGDDDSDHENAEELVSDFKLKLKFDGEKGKKLFHMQTSKATGDDRFVMDKRFFEEQETTEKISDDEIEKQINILEDVVGRSVTKPKKDNNDQIFNMVRYDPTQEEHKKYIKDKPELPIQKRPKKQKLGQPKVTVEPIVNTDKYYKVDDNLKNIFNSQNEFSLTSLFHTSDETDNNISQDKYQVEKITKRQKKFGRNPFIDDSSDSEIEEKDFEDGEENIDTEINNIPEKFLGSRGVWRESFFFKIDDSRFKDAEEFYDSQYNKTDYTGSQDPRFIQKRDTLREFLKNKHKRHKRDINKKMFSKKLGGTHNNEKHFKSHKVKLNKNTKNIKKKTNVKFSKFQ